MGVWWAVAAGLLLAAYEGAWTGPLRGLAVGLLIGSAYVWLLTRRTDATTRLSVPRAVAAAQAGGAARMVFVLLGFLLCVRIWPDVAFAWAGAAFFVPVVVRLIGVVRGGQR